MGVLLGMLIWESALPARVRQVNRWWHWGNNLALVMLNSFVLRLIFPAAAIGMTLYAQKQGWGLLNQLDWPTWLEVLLAMLLLDLGIYLQHVLVHHVPLLWRLHRVHHADPDYDVTTGLRFHPLEIIFSMLIKFALVIVLGPPLLAVLLFEIFLNAGAMFNHANIHLPPRIDAMLRKLIVTPDMHRVHHSTHLAESNSNFGFNLSIWDRLFNTYQAQPVDGHADMQIGVTGLTDQRDCVRLDHLLLLPLGKAGQQAEIKRQEHQHYG